MTPADFFSKENKIQIAAAIALAEKQTSGEIRVHIENSCKAEVLDCAAEVFKALAMHKTKERNGVLFYLSINDRKFAIIGDKGINAVVPEDFWDTTRELVIEHFKKGEFTLGLIKGIERAGELLKKFFPYQKDDVNEISDEISYGK